MTSGSLKNQRDGLSSAELGQANPLHSIDESETAALLNDRPRASANSASKRPSSKRVLPEHARKTIIVMLISISGILVILLAVTLVFKVGSAPIIEKNPPVLIKAKYGAVAAEEIHCSEIGVEVLKEGGNAVDAAIASCLCIGTVNSFSAGIGGGGFMAIRLPNGTVEIIDFRETAPAASYLTMFKKDPILAQRGGLSVAVPGEIRGLELAHKRYGKLPWERLFAPSVRMAREGWTVGPELARRIQLVKEMMETEPDWSRVFAADGLALREGQLIKREALANTLEAIGKEGADVFYTGEIAKMIVDHVQEHGGILTMQDMKDYRPLVKKPMVGYYQGRKIYTSPAPTSGPALISILNILERYNVGKVKDDANLDTHRLIEAMKFGFAQRTELGDPDFTDLEAKIENMMSKDTAAQIRANISDTRTFPVEYYNPHWGAIDNHGTTHLSAVDKDDMSVALTSTVNLLFGSKLMDPKSGVILNDEMDDFSIPGRANAFGLQPSPYNYPEPGKRPLSSCVPTIVEKDGRFEMALGGSGGSRILTAVLQTMLNVYNHDMNIMDAIEGPRIHHQLMPNVVDIEAGYSTTEIAFLRGIGHNVTIFDRALAKAEVQAVIRETDGYIYASSDTRKHAIAAGY
ncbi:gamma-glutamyltranspeptidase [Gamsiella multidivaricata]|uniref:gamma-glutamyltranspeptidase n=1 Tax=Gamsiella multidivaricata TaxID=101098 RepID=UPI0022211EB1|nr:gamma-glutamyltranspeptidase [Gamsiella multidivaricata]KAG0367486.1 hypothetical protein BGZ54_003779 [Gamsiella multidivaricata]KAI7818630.1 gamma-glutamyltranspeptidase [Gamsiella multidivaricata]